MSSKNSAKRSAKKNWESIFETQVLKINVKIAATSKILNIFIHFKLMLYRQQIFSAGITKNMVDESYWFCITQQ